MGNVYTGGTFDLFHEGHVELLEACYRIAKPFGDVIVGLNTDEFIERFKGKPPVQSFEKRKKMLEACKYVDLVMKNFGEEDSKKTIESVPYQEKIKENGLVAVTHYYHPVDFVAIGTDWAGRDYYGQMGFTKEWLDEKNIVLLYVDRRTGQSTTNLKKEIKEY